MIKCLQAGPKVLERLCWAVTSNMEGWLVEVKEAVRKAPPVLFMVVVIWLNELSVLSVC